MSGRSITITLTATEADAIIYAFVAARGEDELREPFSVHDRTNAAARDRVLRKIREASDVR